MSDSSQTLDARTFEYIARHARADDEFLGELKQAAREQGIPAIWIAPEEASFLAVLLRAARAKEVVEIGTLAGYAAIRMARALPPGGRVRTLELSAAHAAFARSWIARSDVATRIEVWEGDARSLLARIPDESVDATFLDADKSSYGLYLEQSLRILRPGGLVLVDNAFAFGQLFDEQPTDREVPAIRAFNELMAADARVEAVIVPLGDGLWVGVKR